MRTNRIFVYAGALVLFLLSTFCVDARSRQAEESAYSPDKRSIAVRQTAVKVPGAREVTPNFYAGGQPDHKELEALKNSGFDIIVNMRGGQNRQEETEVKKLGMQYVSIPWHCPFPHDKTFAEFLKLVEENPGKKVFVHCRLGDDRTGMAVAAYRMAEQGWSADEALHEMKAFGFTRIHHLICPALAPYEKSFPQRLKTSPAFKDLHSPAK